MLSIIAFLLTSSSAMTHDDTTMSSKAESCVMKLYQDILGAAKYVTRFLLRATHTCSLQRPCLPLVAPGFHFERQQGLQSIGHKEIRECSRHFILRDKYAEHRWQQTSCGSYQCSQVCTKVPPTMGTDFNKLERTHRLHDFEIQMSRRFAYVHLMQKLALLLTHMCLDVWLQRLDVGPVIT